MNGFRDKYELAGHSCSRMMFHCEGDSLCAGWGSPYVHTGGGSPVGHFERGDCWGGSQPTVAPCGQRPWDGHHTRLCPCSQPVALAGMEIGALESASSLPVDVEEVCTEITSSGACGNRVDAPVVVPVATTGATGLPMLLATTAATTWLEYENAYSLGEAAANSQSGVIQGVGCRGDRCLQMRFAYDTASTVDTALSTVQRLEGNLVGTMSCDAGQVAVRLVALLAPDYTTSLRLTCAPLMAGQALSGSLRHVGRRRAPPQPSPAEPGWQEDWLPGVRGLTEDRECPRGSVLVGLQCAGAFCAQKMLTCDAVVTTDASDTCANVCTRYGYSCGAKPLGCSGTCGDLNGDCPTGETCFGSVRRCIATVQTQSVGSADRMPDTTMIARGMACAGTYCSQISLLLLGISTDSSTSKTPVWVSETTVGSAARLLSESTGGLQFQCANGTAITRTECRGTACDDIVVFCAKPLQWQVDFFETAVTTEWFSNAGVTQMMCPSGTVATGIECSPRADSTTCPEQPCKQYCDDKRLTCLPLSAEAAGAAMTSILTAEELSSYVRVLDETKPATTPATTPTIEEELQRSWITIAVAVGVTAFLISCGFWMGYYKGYKMHALLQKDAGHPARAPDYSTHEPFRRPSETQRTRAAAADAAAGRAPTPQPMQPKVVSPEEINLEDSLELHVQKAMAMSIKGRRTETL